MSEIRQIYDHDEEGCATGAALSRPRRLVAANDNPSPRRRRAAFLLAGLILALTMVALLTHGQL